jgi:heterodisulfide reductase subunit A-like polyferredoxin
MDSVEVMVRNMTCTGCGECYSLCPNGYISVKQGDLGFPVPKIEKCDNCGICLKGCPYSYLLNNDEDDK